MSVAWTTERRSSARVRSSRPKPCHAGPETDVPVGGVLVVDAADQLECTTCRQAHALEQELTCEQRTVQVPLREDALSHRATVAERQVRVSPWAVAIPPTTRAAPTASQAVTGSSRTTAPIVSASGEIA